MKRTRSIRLFCAAALVAASLQAVSAVPAAASGQDWWKGRGCVATPSRDVRGAGRVALEVAEQAKREFGLNAVILRVNRGGREVVTSAMGESMTGVPADPAMHFRIGSVAIAFMGTTLLRLADQGRVSLDDPVSRWIPELPNGDHITLRMLGNTTSGLSDYVTNTDFLAELAAHPFRQWTPQELVDFALTKTWYAPGTNWSYSHANFVLLGAALARITHTPLDQVLRQYVIDPLGLSETRNSYTPDIPTPVLHAFTSERGTYEESTFWNPSWTTAPGAVLTGDICDVASSAEGIGAGRLLSPHGYQELLDPGTVGLGGPTKDCPPDVCVANTEELHYGMSVLVLGDWIVQNPSFSGYAAAQGYSSQTGLALAVSTTKGPTTPGDLNTAQVIMNRIAAALGHPIPGKA
ncbi:serine hydrolase domain-containing protein [Yinghuangia seranimata]|uniref:serine hydrolase domain-containing protein n=1 Tax=Yinghuangia seranimata TaxID=408067 RepID=UPI00248C675B|nr:serine hydrolase domain-containing protein [Yinghuangia seranimata]MDI2127572.1 serine hydrolase domain-containing protein [Yinghuangia seranimata]